MPNLSVLFLLPFVFGVALTQSYDYSNQGVNPNRGGRFNIGPVIPILRDDREGPVDGYYSFEFETGDGIRRQEQGSPTGPNGAVVSQGAWSFTFPDGTPAEFSFVADENGYRVESPLLPTPPPLPAHAIAQIEKAERERAQGIIHDGQYRPENEGRFTSSSRRTQSQGLQQQYSRPSTSGQSFSTSSRRDQQRQQFSQSGRFGQSTGGQSRFSSSQSRQRVGQIDQSGHSSGQFGQSGHSSGQFGQSGHSSGQFGQSGHSSSGKFGQSGHSSSGQFGQSGHSSSGQFGQSGGHSQSLRQSRRRQQQRFSESRSQPDLFTQPQHNFGQGSRQSYYK